MSLMVSTLTILMLLFSSLTMVHAAPYQIGSTDIPCPDGGQYTVIGMRSISYGSDRVYGVVSQGETCRGAVVIPANLGGDGEGIPIEEIGEYFGSSAFGTSNITSVYIGKNIKGIQPYSFSTPSLKEVTFAPDIDMSHFRGFESSGITSIKIPKSVAYLGGFEFAEQLKRVEFETGSNLVSIENRAFLGAKALEDITLPNSVSSIGDLAFSGTALKNVSFPPSLSSMGTNAFSNCSLTYVTIPATLLWIHSWFEGCKNLKGIIYKHTQEPTFLLGGVFQPHEQDGINIYVSSDKAGFGAIGSISEYFGWKVNKFVNVKNISPPVVVGKAISTKQSKNKMNLKIGKWAGSPSPTFTYQWYACRTKIGKARISIPSGCQPIKNSTKQNISISKAFKGKYLSASVKAINYEGNSTLIFTKSSDRVK